MVVMVDSTSMPAALRASVILSIVSGTRSGSPPNHEMNSLLPGQFPVMPVVEIGQHGEVRVLEMVLPDPVGEREAEGAGIAPVGDVCHQPPPPFVWAFTHWMNCSRGTTMRLPTRSVGKSASCISSYPLATDTPSTCATVLALRNSGRSS